MFVMGFSKVLN